MAEGAGVDQGNILLNAFGPFAKDYGLRDQIRRAAVSIMLNIAEGFARKSNREFCQFLVIAHGSPAEVQAALYIALDQNYITQEQFENLYGMADETSKITMGFSRYLDQPKSKNSTQKTPNSTNSHKETT
ncbi:four helix bundle protein [Geobacter sp. DSM 9736]|uniref:four helix bundle protein n=1 Tax=Geobacter sp. DSM 9736 TaxID=1277350 RepID=UPI0018D2EFA6|nr:four helix bundle protein [Geobacter sp. DSM 9736]